MPWQYLLSKRSLSTPQRRLGCCMRQPAGLQPTWLLGCPAKRNKPEKHHYDVRKSWRKEEGGRYIHIYIYVCLYIYIYIYIYIYLYVILPYPARMRKRCTIVPRTLQGTLQECRKQPDCYYTGEQERPRKNHGLRCHVRICWQTGARYFAGQLLAMNDTRNALAYI